MKIIFAVVLSLIDLALYGQVQVAPNHKNIQVYGSQYQKLKNGELVLHRHSDKIYAGTTQSNLFNPVKARTSTGIYIEFKTKSPNVVAKFKIAKGLKRGPIFSIFQNGLFTENKSFKYKLGEEITMQLASKYSGKAVIYRITFPLKTDVHFLGLTLDEGEKLSCLKRKKHKVYVAFGDSITHGTGQHTTPETYAYQLAEKLDYELFNLAVGGGKTSPVMAKMIRDDFGKIDMITVLIGFNDYNGEGVTAQKYAQRYTEVLNTIREMHPNTKIYCITLLATKAKNSKVSGISVDDFRKVVRDIVSTRQKEGDKNIFLINGEDITTEADLNDQVHLNVAGAKKFANSLYQEIKK